MSLAAILTLQKPTHAVTGADWNAGNIIADGQFFTTSSLSVSSIQNFLNSQVPTCDTWGTQPYAGTTRAAYATAKGYAPPYTCLKDYSISTVDRATNSYCQAVTGGTKTASQMLYDISNACGINSKVLLVMLQKEQGLVTDDWPWSLQYRSAMGFGCPDTAPCDAQYYGLDNQLYNAARQFKAYAANQTSYRYRAYQSNYIQWSPTTSCGGSEVYIQNLATASLYNYTPYQPNQAALNNLNAQGDNCSAYGNRNFWRYYNDWFGSPYSEEQLISFKAHVGNIGWMDSVSNSGIAGTTGQKLLMEAFKISGEVEYSSYSYTTGWQPTVSNGMVSGTVGQARAIQAIKINLTGNLATKYDIWYRAHVTNIGWMDWTKNGQAAGVTGDVIKNIEAFEIYIAPKGFSAPGASVTPYQNIATLTPTPPLSLSVDSHVSWVGWQPVVADGMVTGTIEQNKAIEAIKINLNNTTGLDGSILYATHVGYIGWQNYVQDGQLAGTTGQAKPLEAIRMTLTGKLAENYDIFYRTYIHNKGWLAWAKNNMPAGSQGAALQLEAMEIRLVPKGTALPITSSDTAFYNPRNLPIIDTYSLTYSSHVGYIGWIDGIHQNQLGGTTGQAKLLEAVRFTNLTSIFGSDLAINCSAYVARTGWIENVTTNGVCGTTGQAKTLEAIRLSLSGALASKYDIYYQAHISYVGWQNWVKNGETAGTPGSGKNIEAIVVKLVEKP